MTAAPYPEYTSKRPLQGRMGAPAIGGWLLWPTSGTVYVYSNYGPTATALGGYTAGGSSSPGSNLIVDPQDTVSMEVPIPSTPDASNTIGQLVNTLTDTNGATWYQVDTSNGSLPASTSWPGASNTVYVPAFGDTSNPDVTNLTAAQQQANGAQTNFTSTNTSPNTTTPGGTRGANGTSNNPGGGLGWLQSPGIGPFTNGESLFFGLFLALAGGAVVYNASK